MELKLIDGNLQINGVQCVVMLSEVDSDGDFRISVRGTDGRPHLIGYFGLNPRDGKVCFVPGYVVEAIEDYISVDRAHKITVAD